MQEELRCLDIMLERFVVSLRKLSSGCFRVVCLGISVLTATRFRAARYLGIRDLVSFGSLHSTARFGVDVVGTVE